MGLAKGRSWDRTPAHDRGLKVTQSAGGFAEGYTHGLGASSLFSCLRFNILKIKTKETKQCETDLKRQKEK